MAKEIDSTVVAENLVKDSEEVKIINVCLAPMARRKRMLYDDYEPYFAERIVSYPPSVTDQTHALSIAEQVKVGQAQVRNDDILSDYDFAPGVKDDGRAAVGVFEYSEPAERFEAERVNAIAIEKDLQTQIARRRATENEETIKDTSKTSGASKTPSDASKTPSEKMVVG